MKRLLLILAATLSGLSAAQAAGWPLYPVHIERQYGSRLVIEHTPVGGVVGVRHMHRTKVVVRKHRLHRLRRVAVRHRIHRRAVVVAREHLRHDPALAGGCYDGGFVTRPLPAGAIASGAPPLPPRTPRTPHRDACGRHPPPSPRPETKSPR